MSKVRINNVEIDEEDLLKAGFVRADNTIKDINIVPTKEDVGVLCQFSKLEKWDYYNPAILEEVNEERAFPFKIGGSRYNKDNCRIYTGPVPVRFIPWNGEGECPVERNTSTFLFFESGKIEFTEIPQIYLWKKIEREDFDNIIGYARVIFFIPKDINDPESLKNLEEIKRET